MSYGGYNNYNNQRRINEEEVPESKHTIFVRGLPGSMSTDEVKDYFEDKIGPVSFDFVKVSPDNMRLFVAVRFESREDAKTAMNKYCDRDLLGYRCELTWFKDIRRFSQYQQAHGNQRGGNRGRASQHNNNRGGGDRSRHHERRKTRSRSRSRSKSSSSRSRSRSSKSSRSRSPPPSRRRKASRSSSRGSRGRSSSSDFEKSKKKRDRKIKRTRRSSSREPGETRDSGDDINITKLRAGIAREPTASPISMNMESRTPSPEPPVVNPASISLPPVAPSPLKINIRTKPADDPNSPANVLQNTTFSIGMDEDDAPPRVIRKLTPDSRSSSKIELNNGSSVSKPPEPPASKKPTLAASLPPPPVPPCLKKETSPAVAKGTFKPIGAPVADSSYPPVKTEIKQEVSMGGPEASLQKSFNVIPTKFPLQQQLFSDLRTFQSNLINKVKYEPKEEEFGLLRLSSLSRPSDDDAEDEESKVQLREQKLASLDQMQMERFKIHKKKIDAAFKNDCETFVFVTKKLLEKDQSLEQSLRMSLIENMEDLEKQMVEKIDLYLSTNC